MIDEEQNEANKLKKKKSSSSKPLFWSAECKYNVILEVATDHNWKLTADEKQINKVNLFWIDVASIHEHFRTIQPWQCINHFPGMPNIARKNRMGQNLNRMQKTYPKEYSFYPRTWVLPSEISDFRSQFDNNGVSLNNKIFIIKPDAGCQGRGIFLTRTLDNVPLSDNVVAQVYIKKPLLIDGFKFDLRIYVIVTSVKPLRMYLFHDGLVRMCTEEYVKPTKNNLGMMCMHLTNYAVNKHNDNFQQPSASTSEECQDEGSKRSLLWFMNWVRKERGDAKADWLWKRIGVLCTRTILSIMPTLSREYDQHFKSFTGIPVDMSKIVSGLPTNNSNNNNNNNAVSTAANTTLNNNNNYNKTTQMRGRPGGPFYNNSNNNNNKKKEEEDPSEEHDETEENKLETESQNSSNQDDTAHNNNNNNLPKTRGSRCFEILGFDIMLDTNLNPWLIEVNHLPR
jgi:tubulin polyglutamylase TTLL6/13